MTISGTGNADLLHGEVLAFFAPRQCPGIAIRSATAWALRQARAGCTVISGFHSPLEQSVLRLLVEAGSPVIVALARPVLGARLNPAWRLAFAARTMAVVSHSKHLTRLNQQVAERRNELAARLATSIVVAHTSPGGQLGAQCSGWLAEGLNVSYLSVNGEPG